MEVTVLICCIHWHPKIPVFLPLSAAKGLTQAKIER